MHVAGLAHGVLRVADMLELVTRYTGAGECSREIFARRIVMGIPAGTLKPKVKKILSGAKATGSGGAKGILRKLGPGLITGASDDDPSGIATYSQVGAQFGYGLLWTMVLTYPLMAAIQEISARIGRVTGSGIAANLRKSYPKPILY